MSLSVKTSLQSAIAAWSPYTDIDVKRIGTSSEKCCSLCLLRLQTYHWRRGTGLEYLGK